MLKLLDRYVLEQYFSKFASSIIAFIVIFLIVDVIEHLDKFIDSAMPRGDILSYYLHTLPWFISIGLPMSLLLSTIFCLGILQRKHEIAAIKASGISIRRISVPLLIVGVVFSAFSFYFDNLVVAPSLNKRSFLEEKYFQKTSTRFNAKKQDIFRQISQDEILSIKRYTYKTNTAHLIALQLFSEGKIAHRLDAPSMVWDDSKKAWRVPEYRIRKWDEDGKLRYSHSARDTLLYVNFTPVDLTTESVKPEEMNYWELSSFVKKLKQNGIKDPRWEVNLHFKSAFACSSFLMILFGLSLSIGKPRSNMGVGMGISIFVIFLYYGVLKFGQTLGYRDVLDPFIANWFGNIIFLAIGVFLFFKTRT